MFGLWKEHGFEIILGLCVAFIIILALYHKITGAKGTWSEKPRLPDYVSSTPSKKCPPKESKGESECRRVLQSIFSKPFDKSRPDFLRNPVTGGNFNLELDCYNPELRIAVEYNGIQHYQYNAYMHRNKEAFLNQKYRDDMKRRICKEHGILLIEVPYTVQIADIRGFLVTELRKAGIQV
jgi:hypothetical protein